MLEEKVVKYVPFSALFSFIIQHSFMWSSRPFENARIFIHFSKSGVIRDQKHGGKNMYHLL